VEVYVVLAGLFIAEGLAVYFWGRARGRFLERARVSEWLTEMAESGQDAQEAEDEARRDSRGNMLGDAADILRDAEADGDPS
jgi:hypothetical protein